MALARITEGDGIDYDLINLLIDRLNQLEEANNLQALWVYDTASSAYSMTDRVIIQAGSTVLNPGHAGANWAVKTIDFPRRFSAVPAVTHMSTNTPGWTRRHDIQGVSESQATLVVQHGHDLWGTPIGPTRVSWIAVGPVASF